MKKNSTIVKINFKPYEFDKRLEALDKKLRKNDDKVTNLLLDDIWEYKKFFDNMCKKNKPTVIGTPTDVIEEKNREITEKIEKIKNKVEEVKKQLKQKTALKAFVVLSDNKKIAISDVKFKKHKVWNKEHTTVITTLYTVSSVTLSGTCEKNPYIFSSIAPAEDARKIAENIFDSTKFFVVPVEIS